MITGERSSAAVSATTCGFQIVDVNAGTASPLALCLEQHFDWLSDTWDLLYNSGGKR